MEVEGNGWCMSILSGFVGVHLYSFHISHVLSRVHSSKASYTLSHVCFSQTSSQKTTSRKTLCDTTDFPKKPEIPTSYPPLCYKQKQKTKTVFSNIGNLYTIEVTIRTIKLDLYITF
jgi:5-methylcytosine-specific restriction endonuclease McrA